MGMLQGRRRCGVQVDFDVGCRKILQEREEMMMRRRRRRR